MITVEETRYLVNLYGSWIRDKTAVLQAPEGHISITTPFLDRHNDHIQLYIKQEDDGYVLTDDGYTIQDLELSGYSSNFPGIKDLLKTIIAGFNVQNLGDILAVKTSIHSFALDKHNLVQAILAVNNLFYHKSYQP